MNIFQKACPECAAVNPMTAAACRCGYRFESDARGGADPDEYAEEQNRLYCDYLAARIVQAEAELAVARAQANADSRDTRKAADALLAEQEFNALRAEMKQLSLHTSTRTRPEARQRPQASPAQTGGAARAENAPAAAPAKTAATGIAAAHPLPAKPKPASDSKSEAAGSMPIRGGAAGTKAPAPAKAIGNEQRRAPRASATAKPNEAFTRLQAQRAEAVTQAKKIAATKRPQPATAGAPPRAIVPAAAPAQVCPNCTATVAPDAKRCSCGYTFSRAEEVPALSLDAGALAILTGETPSPGSRRR